MYVKIVFSLEGTNSSNARNSHQGLSNLINSIMNGGNIQVGQSYNDGTVHEVSGTGPTAGVYTTLNSWTYSSPYYYSMWRKKHTDNTSCTRDITMVFDWGSAYYGQSFSVGTNGVTNTSSGGLNRSAGHTNSSTSAHYNFPYTDYWSKREVHVVISDDVFAVTQITTPDASNYSSVYTFTHMDFEYNPNVDDHLTTLNSAYYPGVEYGSIAHYSGEATSGKVLFNNYHRNTFWSPQHYNGRTQTFQNMVGGGQSYTTQQMTEQMANGYYIGVISPRMTTKIPHRVIDLETVPIMVPVTFEGFRYGGQYWNEMPRNVKGMFRVSDDIVTNGDIINAGSPATEYRVLAPFNVNTSNSNQWTHVAFEV